MTGKDLKNSILQLAIQGKLVEQREEEGSAKELLKKIDAEKKQLINEGKINKQKRLPEISEDEIPFDIPESWEWVRLSDLSLFIKAGGDKPKDFLKAKTESHTVPVIANGIQNDGIIGYTKVATVEEPSVTVSGRGTIGFSCLRTEPFTPVVRLLVINISDQLIKKYIQNVLTALLERGVGTSIKQLTVPMIEPKLIPLPPLEEQKRIVAKIEELLPLVEKYNQVYSDVEELNKNFPEDMQKAILQYAIQGNLVEQREDEGTAEELYKRIQEEKKKLIKEGKIKKQKKLPEIKEEEIPFDIPESWKWVRLGELCNYGQCNSIPASKIPNDAWILDLEDVEKDSGRVLKKKRMRDAKSNSSKHIFNTGDVLYSKLRPYLNKVVIADENGYSTSEILPLNFGANVYNKYAQILLMSPYFISYTIRCSYGVKMPRLGTTDGQSALFPLPPLVEQKRIIEKIYELLPLVKQLVK